MSNFNFAPRAGLLVLPFVLTACGGAAGVGVSGGGAVTSPPPPTGCVDAAACKYGSSSTHLGGVGVLTKRNLSLEVVDRSVSRVSVDLDAPDNSITYKDSKLSTKGAVAAGDISDPDSTVIAQDNSGSVIGTTLVAPGPGYEFVKVVQGNNVASTTPYEMDGYVGLLTDASAVPTAGSATYSGSARGGLDTGGLLPEGLLGSAKLTANFGTGKVNLTADFSMATNGADLVKVTGMTINGNSFSGGTLSVMEYDALPAEDHTTVSNVLGGGVTHESTGVFFGIDESLALNGGGTTIGPDEVAGAVVATGSDAELSFTYVAD